MRGKDMKRIERYRMRQRIIERDREISLQGKRESKRKRDWEEEKSKREEERLIRRGETGEIKEKKDEKKEWGLLVPLLPNPDSV